MNDMKELEAQLRSWTPRRPSPAIERKLFRAGRRRQHLPSSESAPSAVRFAWLAPVTAALLLACIVLNQHGGPTPVGATNTPMVAMIMSNQSAAAYLPGSFQNGQNIITANSFEWTNGSRSTSSIGSPSGSEGKH